ncbi:flippase [Halalkalicoccus sp. NIPERK01]|uniref:flippase n=1 Tax=Halalkalicoccus sp. NIPERK01 TaxID=3053469 RepID=UPI00256EC540|nr:flippase [Halalkalicoccus sp. NIPERK01]MDL5361704.1 flippase [Halalkalicoccus sp. NIPERK01]
MSGNDSTATMAREGSITFVGNLIKKGFGFLIIAVITRLVSPSVYGLFILATSIILFVQAFATLGLPKAIDYFVPQYLSDGEHDKARGVILVVFALVLATSAVVAGLIVLGAGTIAAAFDEPALGVALLVLSVTVPFLAVYNALLASFSAIKRLKFRVYMRDVIRPTVRLIATAALLLAGYGLLGVVGGYLIGLVVAIVAGVYFLRENAPRIVGAETTRVPSRPLLWYSVPLAFASIIYIFLGQIDYFVVGYFYGSEEVGIYRVGYALAANLMIFSSSLGPIFKPLIAETKADRAAVRTRYRTATRWIAGLTLPVALVVAFGASAYLSVVFTPQYTVATAAVVILAVGITISAACGGPDGGLLQGLGYSRLVFLNTAVLLVINVGVSVLLVPRIGITGAAIGTASALTVNGLLAVAEGHRFHDVHPLTRDLGKILLAAVPAAIGASAVVLAVDSPYVVAFALPAVVFTLYVGTLHLTNAFTAEDGEIAAQISPALRRAIALSRR